jgi:tetratricopeptide (TPR) repeat protein
LPALAPKPRRRAAIAVACRLLLDRQRKELSMRNLTTILKVLAASAAITSFVACEEVDPPRRTEPAVAPVVPPSSPPSSAVTPPTLPVAPPAPVVMVPAIEDEGAMKAAELISGARAALASSELDRALKLARLATRRAPNRSTAWNTLGRVQLRRGERKDAIESFEKAVELNPSSSYAQNNLGLALIYDGRYEDAVDALEEATSLEPVEGYMWNNLGMAYEHLDRLDDARQAYSQAMELKGMLGAGNLERLKGVKTIVRTAKADLPRPAAGQDVDLPATGVETTLDGGAQ